MHNSLFPITWRSKEVKVTNEERELPIGQFDLLRVEKKFIEVITNFIRGIFNYENIKVTLVKKNHKRGDATGYSSGKLEPANGHTKFQFAVKLFNDQFYEFNVAGIPATTNSGHIRIFFGVLMNYIQYFYKNIKNNMLIIEGSLKASPSFIELSDIWLYNIERTIIIEYIYYLFNFYDQDYTNELRLLPNPLRYDIDLITTILDFAIELSTKRVENKEIYCGFIFHDKIGDIKENSIRSIKINKQFDFGDFGQLKNYLEVSNGQNIFFNVTNDKVTHTFITREKINEIIINPISSGKTFARRPLILSIQGTGKIIFLEGRSDYNRTILQITDSKPIIRDNDFIEKFIYDSLKKSTMATDDQLEVFSKWVMSLSQKKHGTSLIFSDISSRNEKKLVKHVRISIKNKLFLDRDEARYDLSLLDSIISPDGAVVFNKSLMPTHIGTILPIGKSSKGTSGGARHNSVANFSKEIKCLGIVISEDGPITIFKNGNILIKF